MQFIVFMRQHIGVSSMRIQRTVEAASKQDAIEAAVDGHPTPEFLIVDFVTPVNPAEEK